MKKIITLLALSWLLSGCQNMNENHEERPTSSEEAPVIDVSVVTACTQELSALQKVSPTVYKARSTELGNVQAQEQLYMKVRNNIGKNSVSIMDAAYRYKISRICNDIQHDLTTELVDKVEKAYQPATKKIFSDAG